MNETCPCCGYEVDLDSSECWKCGYPITDGEVLCLKCQQSLDECVCDKPNKNLVALDTNRKLMDNDSSP